MRIVTKNYVLLMLAAFGLGAAGALFWLREPMEPLTREALAAARQRWRSAGISDYELRYRMQASAYVVRFRNGIVHDVKVNDKVPTSGNWSAYGVEGLFEMLGQELDNAADPAGPFAGGKAILLRVRFHPQRGYVERYLRSSGGGARGAAIDQVTLRPRP
jgi:hypothetical protein